MAELPDERWLDVLNPVIYPSFETRRDSALAPGCPRFGQDSVLDRPEASGKGTTASVRPGLIRPQCGEHSVTWWDPAILKLDIEEEVGLRQQKILQVDEGAARSEAGIRAHEHWQQRRQETLAIGSTESIRSVRIVELASERHGHGKVSIEQVATDRASRPFGKRFGTLVHVVLAAVDLEAEHSVVFATARIHGRILAATNYEIEAAAKAVESTLAHNLLRRAAEAAKREQLRRETPVLLRLQDGRLAEGTVDLVFRESEGSEARWTVVDFKSDRELGARLPEYEAQVALYADAIAQATGEGVEAVLLIV
jgi:ATP-dependent exoDNAse (exonuclease V) beta subunit